MHIEQNTGFPPSVLQVLLSGVNIWPIVTQTTLFGVLYGEVVRGVNWMETIMASETTKVKKMDDNGTE